MMQIQHMSCIINITPTFDLISADYLIRQDIVQETTIFKFEFPFSQVSEKTTAFLEARNVIDQSQKKKKKKKKEKKLRTFSPKRCD